MEGYTLEFPELNFKIFIKMPKFDISASRGAALHIIFEILMTNQLRALAYQPIVYHRKVTLYRFVYLYVSNLESGGSSSYVSSSLAIGPGLL